MLSGIEAVVLAGGAGTRLRSVVSSVPKPLAPVGDRPFLELLVRQLHHQGIRRIVMCTGYLSEQVESAFGDGRDLGVEIRYSKEEIRSVPLALSSSRVTIWPMRPTASWL